MNACADGGYLVGGLVTIPADPTDHHVAGLPTVACSRLRCRHCQALVRHSPRLAFRSREDIGHAALTELYEARDFANSPLLHEGPAEWRLYLCRCSRWLATDRHACQPPAPDANLDLRAPWQCDGHPSIALPHDIDGELVHDRNELRALATRGLRGSHPPFVRPPDAGGAWLWRLPFRLAPGDARIVIETALAALDDAEPATRARALELFTLQRSPAAPRRVLQLLVATPQMFVDVKNTTTLFLVDKTLEDTAWRVLEPLVAAGGEARSRARSQVLAGKGTRGIFDMLAKHDPDWIVANAEAIAAADPARATELMWSFSELPEAVPIKALRERVRKIIAPRGTSPAP